MHCFLPGCQFEGAEEGKPDSRYCQRCGKAAILNCLRYRECDYRDSCGIVVGRDASCSKFGTIYRYNSNGLPFAVSAVPRYAENEHPAETKTTEHEAREFFDLRAASGDPLYRTSLSALTNTLTPILYPNQQPDNFISGRAVQCFPNPASVRKTRLRHDRLYALLDSGEIGVAGLYPAYDSKMLPQARYWDWYKLPGGLEANTPFEVGETTVIAVHRDFVYGFDASVGGGALQRLDEVEPLFRFRSPVPTDPKISLCGDALLLIGRTQDDHVQIFLYSISRLAEGHTDILWQKILGRIQHEDLKLPKDIVARPGAFYFFNSVSKDLVALRHQLQAPPRTRQPAPIEAQLEVVYQNRPFAHVHSFALGNDRGVIITEADRENRIYRLIELSLGGSQSEILKSTELRNLIPNSAIEWCGLCGANDDVVLMDFETKLHRIPRDNPDRPIQTWTPFQDITTNDEMQVPMLAVNGGRWYIVVGRIDNSATSFRAPQYRIIALDKPGIEMGSAVGIPGSDGIFTKGTPIELGFSGHEAYFIDCKQGDAIVQRLA